MLARCRPEGRHQDSVGAWRNLVAEFATGDLAAQDLVAAFKRLNDKGIVRLSKPQGYPAVEVGEPNFFYRGTFDVEVTDEGRLEWDHDDGETVFISHIGEEREAALALKDFLRTFLGPIEVFVSADPESMGGGEEWFSHILDNLKRSRLILTLSSPESQTRPWINFEAGFVKGRGCRIVPLLYRGLDEKGLKYPLAGYQAVKLTQLGTIADLVEREIPQATRKPFDEIAEWRRIERTAQLVFSDKVTLRPILSGGPRQRRCDFELINDSNEDIEPVEVELIVAKRLLASAFRPAIDRAVLEVSDVTQGEGTATKIIYRNNIEPRPGPFNNAQPLVKRLSPGQHSKLEHLFFEVNWPPNSEKWCVAYAIRMRNRQPIEGEINLSRHD